MFRLYDGTNVKSIFIVFLVIFCVSCSMVPSSGPSLKNMSNTAGALSSADYAVVKLRLSSINQLNGNKKKIENTFEDTRPSQVLNVGSKIVITVWESSELGILATTGLQGIPQELEVDQRGVIFFPFAGEINVTGLTLFELSEKLKTILEGRAVEPQIQVQFNDDSNLKVTVMGQVNEPGSFSIPSRGYKILEVIAIAGGTKQPSYESEVIHLRKGHVSKLRMEDIILKSENNINISPMDFIHVFHRPKSFSALGAVEEQSKQLFSKENLSLMEALAQSGGLKDELADAGAVFLFRFESLEKLNLLNIPIPEVRYPDGLPTIYTLDFNEPNAFFLASSFSMRDRDVLFVSNASGAEFKKFAEIVLAPFVTMKKL